MKHKKGNECLGAGHHENEEAERLGGKPLVPQKPTDPEEVAKLHSEK